MNKHGLYSKAAQLIRGLPQERGTVEQMVAAAKAKGLKDAELSNAGKLPTGKISREDLAQMFETRMPSLKVSQYGENPSYLSRQERLELRALQEAKQGPLMDFEKRKLEELKRRASGAAPIDVMMQGEDEDGNADPESTIYEGYHTDGGKNYRERLLKLDQSEHPALRLDQTIGIKKRQLEYETPAYGADHPIIKDLQNRLAELQAERERAVAQFGEPKGPTQRYHSSHWTDHPDVIAHIRMQDRTVGEDWPSLKPVAEKLAQGLGIGSTRELASGAVSVGIQRGVITPEEGASLSRVLGWRNGYDQAPGVGKRLLHVEELQSDWGQEGRDKGFYDPEKPYQLYDWQKGRAISNHGAEDEAAKAAEAMGPDATVSIRRMNTGRPDMPPVGPYVQNTQHWTDLALKNVLREAAMGNYDGVVFTPGQAQADRYGLEKHVDHLHYHPDTSTLTGNKAGSRVFSRPNVSPEDLPSLIGKEVSERLLSPENTGNAGTPKQFHELRGEDLKVGGGGMKGYYDQIVPKSVMRLAQMHDPEIKPAEPVSMTGEGNDYQGFHLPMTPKLKQGVLNEGFPAFRRGGRVAFAQGGKADEQGAGSYPEASAETGSVPVAGGVRGGAGVLQAQDEAPLEGLPASVRIPLTGETIKASPDPRVRAVARSYMQQAGLPYNPPTKYAKVDPARAKRIAAAYEAMPHNPDDPLTKASYAAMIRETMAQYQAARAAGFRAEFWNPAEQQDPYQASPRLAVEDVRKNHHMWVYPTLDGYGSGAGITEDEARRNPMLQLTGETWNGIPVTVNDIFRAIHDYYGHAKEGVGFRHDGEENAWRAHASMFSPLARLAMTTETRGQNSWLNFGPHGEKNQTARTEDTVFAPQKMGILPHWAHHEGAEDFMGPEEIAEMSRQRVRHSSDVEKALGMTRRFTKDGQHVTMRLKD